MVNVSLNLSIFPSVPIRIIPTVVDIITKIAIPIFELFFQYPQMSLVRYTKL